MPCLSLSLKRRINCALFDLKFGFKVTFHSQMLKVGDGGEECDILRPSLCFSYILYTVGDG